MGKWRAKTGGRVGIRRTRRMRIEKDKEEDANEKE